MSTGPVEGTLQQGLLRLDEERRGDWRYRLDLWSREHSDPELTAKRDAQVAPWRERGLQRVKLAQKDGWLRDDQQPEELLKGLFALMVGVALQLLKDPDSEAVHLRVMDAYLDDLLDEEAAQAS